MKVLILREREYISRIDGSDYGENGEDNYNTSYQTLILYFQKTNTEYKCSTNTKHLFIFIFFFTFKRRVHPRLNTIPPNFITLYQHFLQSHLSSTAPGTLQPLYHNPYCPKPYTKTQNSLLSFVDISFVTNYSFFMGLEVNKLS